MDDPVKKGAIYEDVLGSPPDKVAELIEGDLYLSPRPAPRHANAASTLASDIHDSFQRGRSGPGGWWILFEPELHFGENVLVPDIAGWTRERLVELPQIGMFELAPDWVCEVLSPSTGRLDRRHKVPIYAREGVRHLWIVDPSLRTLEVYVRKGAKWAMIGAHFGEACVSAPPFDAVSIELGALWT